MRERMKFFSFLFRLSIEFGFFSFRLLSSSSFSLRLNAPFPNSNPSLPISPCPSPKARSQAGAPGRSTRCPRPRASSWRRRRTSLQTCRRRSARIGRARGRSGGRRGSWESPQRRHDIAIGQRVRRRSEGPRERHARRGEEREETMAVSSSSTRLMRKPSAPLVGEEKEPTLARSPRRSEELSLMSLGSYRSSLGLSPRRRSREPGSRERERENSFAR